MRPGNKPITASEWEIIERAKTSGCIPCIIWREQGNAWKMRFGVFMYAGWDHSLRGGIRIGHLAGFASCNWHHQGYTIDACPQVSAREMERMYGPSKAHGSIPFHRAFGSEEQLIHRQAVHLGLDPLSQSR